MLAISFTSNWGAIETHAFAAAEMRLVMPMLIGTGVVLLILGRGIVSRFAWVGFFALATMLFNSSIGGLGIDATSMLETAAVVVLLWGLAVLRAAFLRVSLAAEPPAPFASPVTARSARGHADPPLPPPAAATRSRWRLRFAAPRFTRLDGVRVVAAVVVVWLLNLAVGEVPRIARESGITDNHKVNALYSTAHAVHRVVHAAVTGNVGHPMSPTPRPVPLSLSVDNEGDSVPTLFLLQMDSRQIPFGSWSFEQRLELDFYALPFAPWHDFRVVNIREDRDGVRFTIEVTCSGSDGPPGTYQYDADRDRLRRVEP